MNSVAAPGESKAAADWRPLHGILFTGLLVLGTLVPFFRSWPWLWAGPLLVYAGVVAICPPLKASFRGWKFGNPKPVDWALTAFVAVGSCSALAAFQYWVKPDLHYFAIALPGQSLSGLILAGIGFSVVNALLEEIVFRGVIFDAVESQWGAWVAVIVTAAFFGYGHLRGYPPGPLGAWMAGVYGLFLGWIRVRTGGLGLPVLAHVLADATIFTHVASSGVWGSVRG